MGCVMQAPSSMWLDCSAVHMKPRLGPPRSDQDILVAEVQIHIVQLEMCIALPS